MEDIIEHMLKDPRKAYYATGIGEALGLFSGSVSPLMRIMHEAGWLSAEVETPQPAGRQARKYYRFTDGSAAELRRAIDQWQ